jgi:hypothetical protein
MILCVNDEGRFRELTFSHPPKNQRDWRPGQSRLDKRYVYVKDRLDEKFHLRLTKSEALDMILHLEIETGDMDDA